MSLVPNNNISSNSLIELKLLRYCLVALVVLLLLLAYVYYANFI